MRPLYSGPMLYLHKTPLAHTAVYCRTSQTHESKIEDGSDTGTLRPQVVTVADFRKRLRLGPQLVLRFPHSARPSARRQPPWQESMDG